VFLTIIVIVKATNIRQNFIEKLVKDEIKK